MIEIVTATIGLFVIYLPGHLLTLILFEKLKRLERICVSFALSISILVALGFLLTLLSLIMGKKAITMLNTWLSLLFISVILLLIIAIRKFLR